MARPSQASSRSSWARRATQWETGWNQRKSRESSGSQPQIRSPRFRCASSCSRMGRHRADEIVSSKGRGKTRVGRSSPQRNGEAAAFVTSTRGA